MESISSLKGLFIKGGVEDIDLPVREDKEWKKRRKKLLKIKLP
jgi:hypothetical protein